MQPLAVGVMVKTTESIIEPLLVMVCAGILPFPFDEKPVRLPLWVTFQLKVVPAVAEVIFTTMLVPLLQMV